ncbi:MAG TPA: ribonuclease E/G [Xanthobacteraceae bacterium]|nr:ribonuclease E/G [Xanthobacteraceae bacterium]
MANKMLIDATHPEETRVVVLRGNRVEEFDFETAHRKQLRGNIYLAKVTRVEPSLQAAFVEYGGNRHGFLAFSEIHPDYYQIPVADRQALLDEDERAARAADDDDRRGGRRRDRHRHRDVRRHERQDEVVRSGEEHRPAEAVEGTAHEAAETPAGEAMLGDAPLSETPVGDTQADDAAPRDFAGDESPPEEPKPDNLDIELIDPQRDLQYDASIGGGAAAGDALLTEAGVNEASALAAEAAPTQEGASETSPGEEGTEEEVVESVGGADAMEEVPDRAPRYRRQYKIQEVIKRRQVMLVQVVKEERGTKGAALTTYLSLAGRYCVLMPNTARGGGISRKITSADDRKKLREIADELEVPDGMGVILRTAGANRSNVEVTRDFEYLLRQWEMVRDLTLKSTAPTLVYEEGSLIKRSIRDLYGKDVDEIIVAGEAGYNEAKEFMRMLMPSHAKNVKLYRDGQPIFTRYGIESQLDAMFSPVVQLRSGGYIVLNQTEALVSIDVNSGRSTREHHIEDTALKTNIEAAEEIARQLRLRDLAGLIVIDFIDMDEKRNNRTVERRLKDALRNDRARIQVGRISHFGLLEMSRQRIRTSVLESSTEKCPHCGGTGHIRSVSSVALQLLRAVEETILKGATHNLIVRTRPEIALYVLNQKRSHLNSLEERFHITITISSDPQIGGLVAYAIDRGEQVMTIEQARALVAQAEAAVTPIQEEEEPEFAGEEELAATGEMDESMPEAADERPQPPHFDGEREGGHRRRRRRRRGRGGGGREHGPEPVHGQFTHDTVPEHNVAHEDDFEEIGGQPGPGDYAPQPQQHGQQQPGHDRGEERGEGRGEGEHRRRRRGRRGGRRNRRNRENYGDFGGEQRGEFRGEQRNDRNERGEHYRPPAPDMNEPPSTPPFEPARPETAPAAAEPANVPPPQAEPEAPRRRSTVREPAPVFSGHAAETPPPPLAPAASEEAVAAGSNGGEDANKPRRTGWWAKRFLGGKD